MSVTHWLCCSDWSFCHLNHRLSCLCHDMSSSLDLDHTADIQLHAWGDTLEEAFEQVALAMFSYVTDLSRVDIDPDPAVGTLVFDVRGHDWDSLLYNYLEELLFRFSAN